MGEAYSRGGSREDELMSEPCSFGGLLHFMQMWVVEEAQEEYLNKLEERIHHEAYFAKQTKVV